jgi:hypothetical protein
MPASQGNRPFNEVLGKADYLNEHAITPAEKNGKHSKSMHDRVAVWCDCCSCEAEPYWVAIADQVGTEISSGHKDAGMEK